MSRKPSPSVGDVVSVEFEDHSEGEQHIVFEVFGVVIRKDRKSLVIGSFVYSNSLDIDENVVVYTILRATIKNLQILRKHSLERSSEHTQTQHKSPLNSTT